MGNKAEQTPIAVCKRCGNSWWKRTPEPKKCPACQSRNWKNRKPSIVIRKNGVILDDGKNTMTITGIKKNRD